MKKKVVVSPKNKSSSNKLTIPKPNDSTGDSTKRKQGFLDLVKSPAQQRRATLKMVIEEAANLQQALATLAAQMPERKHNKRRESGTSDSMGTPSSNGGENSSDNRYVKPSEPKKSDRKSKLSCFSQALNPQSQYAK